MPKKKRSHRGGEIFLCQQCGGRVNRASDEYVIPNRVKARSSSQWVYEHARCAESRVALIGTTPAEAKKLLNQMIAAMTNESLRQLGLQRIGEGEPAKEDDAADEGGEA